MDSGITQKVAATLGMFDGVHAGHRYVISQLCQIARGRGMRSMIITFDCHPRQVVQTDWKPQLLTSLEQKVELLRQTGADCVEVLHFDHEMSLLSAREFMSKVLIGQFGVNLLLTGYDNRFGHREKDCREQFEDYQRYGQELGMEVILGEALSNNQGKAVSSSVVRSVLAQGDVEEASLLLGRQYSMTGTVEHGLALGRRMGFPTANIRVDANTMIPANGVYAVMVGVEGQNNRLMGMTNIGVRPTFANGNSAASIETHLLDYCDDMYGKTITLYFVARLRQEQRFSSADALASQLLNDAAHAREILVGKK